MNQGLFGSQFTMVQIIVIAGIVAGFFLVGSLAYVFIKERKVTWSGLAVGGIGAGLIALGVIANVKITWGEEGGAMEFETVKESLETLSKAVASSGENSSTLDAH